MYDITRNDAVADVDDVQLNAAKDELDDASENIAQDFVAGDKELSLFLTVCSNSACFSCVCVGTKHVTLAATDPLVCDLSTKMHFHYLPLFDFYASQEFLAERTKYHVLSAKIACGK